MFATTIRIALAATLVTVSGCEGDDAPADKPKARSPAVDKRSEPERKEARREKADAEPAWLGVKHQTVDSAMAKKIGRASGAAVVSVSDGSPAAKAGIKVGDVIFSFDGKSVAKPEDLDKHVQNTNAGKKVAVSLMRGKSKKSLTVVMQGRP